MPSFLEGLGLLTRTAAGALEGYGLDKRRRVEEALEAAKEKRDAEAADLMRRVQEQSLATSITNQDLAAAAAGFRAPKALKAAIAKNLTPDLTRTAGFGGVPSLPFDAPSAAEQMQDDLPTITVRGQQLVLDPTQTPTAITQRNKRTEWELQRDANIAAAALKAKEDAKESEKERRNRIRIAEIQAGGSGGRTTASEQRAAGLEFGAKQALDQIEGLIAGGYDPLKEPVSSKTAAFVGFDKTAAALGSPKGRLFRNAVKRLVTNYLYVTSGATANPSEIQSQAEQTTSDIMDDPDTLEQKLTSLRGKVNEMRMVAGMPLLPDKKPYGGVELLPPPEN